MITISMILWLLKVYIVYCIFLSSYIPLCTYKIGAGHPLVVITNSHELLIIMIFLKRRLFDISVDGGFTDSFICGTIEISHNRSIWELWVWAFIWCIDYDKFSSVRKRSLSQRACGLACDWYEEGGFEYLFDYGR